MNDEAPPAPPPAPILVVFPLMLVLGVFAVVTWQVAKPVTNTDTFFHIRMGQAFLDGWTPWDPGSTTRFATADWVPSQWLGQVGLAGFEGWFGLPGVAWLSGALILLFALAAFLVARSQSSLLVAALVMPATVAACAPALSPRPQVLSYLFTLLLTAAWLRARRTGDVPWWVVPLTWLWAMVHGMWIASVVISLVAVVGIVLERPPHRPPLWKLLLVPLLSAVAAGLTPVGPRLYGAVLRVGSITEYYGEWGPTQFAEPATAVAGAMLALLLLIALRSGSMPWSRVALVMLAAAWLAYSNRTVPVAAAMLCPLLAGEIQRVLPRRPSLRAEVPIAVGGFLAAVLALGAAVSWTSDDPTPREDGEIREALDALPAGTGLLNEWDEGGYDMWLYPDLELVMHGYGDMFTDDELARNYGLLTLEPGWYDDLRELGTGHALLYADGTLAHALTEDKGWRVVAESDELSLLEAPATWLSDGARSAG